MVGTAFRRKDRPGPAQAARDRGPVRPLLRHPLAMTPAVAPAQPAAQRQSCATSGCCHGRPA